MKRTPLKRKSTLKRKTALKRNSFKTRKPSVKLYKPRRATQSTPKWLTAIPYGSHGSTPLQKRFWKLTSDYVRIRDFYKYGDKCVSCETRLERWQDGQAAHWKGWTSCNSYVKFNKMNLALSCATCNKFGDQDTGYRFTLEMVRRYGDSFIKLMDDMNKEYHGEKLENHILISMIVALLEKFMSMPEIPDYVQRSYEKYQAYENYKEVETL